MSLAKLLADTLPPALKRFKYLTNKMKSSSDTLSSTQPAAASIQGQINNYLCELQQSPDENNASGVFRGGGIMPWPPLAGP
jgi:uncharacterized phage infection (PIP) family protein YhgE